MKSASDKIRIVSKITSFTDVTKSLQEIEKVLNGLVETIKTPAEKELKETEGSTGDIQITQNKDKSYTFEVRTKEGWKTPVIGNSAIKFTDKPAALSKKQNKSIDEIEIDDTSTGGKDAEKTIFDEKANKFVLARPDYDSGWIEWDHTVRDTGDSAGVMLELSHELGVLPSMYLVYFAPSQSPSSITWFTMLDGKLTYHNDTGIATKVDSEKIYLVAGETHTFQGTTFANPPATANYADGSVKVLMWK